ncbi:hypothetical protein WQ57_17305 [Mesobacillus campisalis]|uniref:DUF3221 domain-containing protein n=1 Tax=Mesobacillus campisalis TaxID=1408103 RepID=A0A0M2SV31_9BACI|nr:DUF3221 domain-containing protein [Mesobacillus campisalis]KKK36817.1 hypothetical protein WQ57_17305 [Mesobacillus campisalis]
MKRAAALWIMVFLFPSLIGCSLNEDTSETEGYIIYVEKGQILLAENLTESQYNEIKDIPIDDLISQSMVPGLIYLSYSLAERFEKGDKVSAVLTGEVAESYPAQAKAKKIEKLQAMD